MSVGQTTTAAVLAGLALAACKPADSTIGADQSSGDVVITTSMNRSGEQETHYAECGPDATADVGDYQVVIPAELDDGGLPEGAPCPDGPRELMPQDEHPELYRQMSDALARPAPYAGGDLTTCGEWEADAPEDARYMLSQCPPLTKGELP